MARTALNVVATTEDRASGPLGNIKRALDEHGTALAGLGGAVTALKAAWESVSAVVGSAVGMFIGVAKDAMEAEKAERDLVSVLKLHGDSVDTILPKLKAQADAIQQATGIDGDAVVALQAYLRTLGVQPQYLESATTAAIGWARTTGKDMTSAGKDVVKVLNGKADALGKLGLKVKTVDEALHAMADGGLAQLRGDMGTLEGGLKRLEQNFGDFRETLGSTITQSGNARGAVLVLGNAVRRLQEIASSDVFKKAVDSSLGTLIDMGAKGIDTIAGLLEASDKFVLFWQKWGSPLASLIQKPIDMAINPIGALKDALDKLGATADVGKKIDDSVASLEQLTDILNQAGVNTELTDQLKDLAISWNDPDRITKKAPAELRELAKALREARAGGGAVDLPEMPGLGPVPTDATDNGKAAAEKADKEKERIAEKWRRYYERVHQEELKRQSDLLRATEAAEKGKTDLIEGRYKLGEELGRKDKEKATKEAEQSKKFEAEAKATRERVSASMVAAYESIKGFLSQGFKDVGDFFGKLAVRAADFLASKVVQSIGDFLASTATGAVSGGGGGILGTIFGGIGKFFGFAAGGIIPSTAGVPGRDSVPILGTPGEEVLPERDPRHSRNIVAAMNSRQALTAGTRSGATINLSVFGAEARDRPSMMRYVRGDIAPALQQVLAGGTGIGGMIG